MSAQFIGSSVKLNTAEVWKDMGLVEKDKFGDWVLSDSGKSIGGRMSKNNYVSVPTYELKNIVEKMVRFMDSQRK